MKITAQKIKETITTLQNILQKRQNNNNNMINLPLSKIATNTQKFQNRRNEYAEKSVKSIVEEVERTGKLNTNKFTPITVWENQGLYYVLSGHSRLEAFRRLHAKGFKDFGSIPANVFVGTEIEAKEFAKNSNNFGTPETILERALLYRNFRIEEQKTEKQVLEYIKATEKQYNPLVVLNLSYLNPQGFTFENYERLLEYSESNTENIKAISEWIGEARRKFEVLTDRHENELFDYLSDLTEYQKIRNKTNFLQKLGNYITLDFSSNQRLNIKGLKSVNKIMDDFNVQVEEIKSQIRAEQKVCETTNPIIKKLQNDLLQLENRRERVIQESKKQTALFGVKKSFKTQKHISLGSIAIAPRPGLIVADEKELPTPFEHVKKGVYAIDESQRLAVNLALDAYKNNKKGFVLADGTGVGKTRIQLVIANEYAKTYKKKVLIVTENRQILAGPFSSDSKALGIDLNDFETATYNDISFEYIKKDSVDSRGNKIKTITGRKPAKKGLGKYGLVVFDEAHNLKNTDSIKAISAEEIQKDKVLFATATPFDKQSGIMYFVSGVTGQDKGVVLQKLGLTYKITQDPKTNEITTSIGWTQELAKKVNNELDRLYPGNKEMQMKMRFSIANGMINERVLSLRKELVANGMMIRREYPFYGEVEQLEYKIKNFDQENEIESYYEDVIEETISQNGYIGEGFLKSIILKKTGDLSRWSEAQKYDFVFEEAMKDYKNGKSVVIVAESVENSSVLKGTNREIPIKGFLSSMSAQFEKKGIAVARVYGANEKTNEIAKFQNEEVKILLATPQSGGTGVNLDDTKGCCPRVLYMVTPNYSGNQFQQILGRVSRRNTATPAHVKIIFSNSTNDASRKEIVAQKLQTLKSIQYGKADVDSFNLLETDTDIDTQSQTTTKTIPTTNVVETPIQKETNNFKDWAKANKKDISMDSLNEYQTKMMFNSRNYAIKTQQEKEEILVLAKGEKATTDIAEITFEEFVKKNQKSKWLPDASFTTKAKAVELLEKLKQSGTQVKLQKDEKKNKYVVYSLVTNDSIQKSNFVGGLNNEMLLPDGKVAYTNKDDEYVEVNKKFYFKRFFPITFVKYSDNDTYFISENNPYIEQYLAHKKNQKPKIKPIEIHNLVHKYFDDANVFFEPISQNITTRVVENGNFSLQIPIFKKSIEDILSEKKGKPITELYFVKFYQLQTKLKNALQAFAKEVQTEGYNSFEINQKEQGDYTTTYEFIYTNTNKPFVPTQITKPETQNTPKAISENTPYLVDYSEKAIAVFGDSRAIKDELKAIGSFNPKLTNPNTGEKQAGWIFPKTKKQEVEKVLSVNSVAETQEDTPKKVSEIENDNPLVQIYKDIMSGKLLVNYLEKTGFSKPEFKRFTQEYVQEYEKNRGVNMEYVFRTSSYTKNENGFVLHHGRFDEYRFEYVKAPNPTQELKNPLNIKDILENLPKIKSEEELQKMSFDELLAYRSGDFNEVSDFYYKNVNKYKEVGLFYENFTFYKLKDQIDDYMILSVFSKYKSLISKFPKNVEEILLKYLRFGQNFLDNKISDDGIEGFVYSYYAGDQKREMRKNWIAFFTGQKPKSTEIGVNNMIIVFKKWLNENVITPFENPTATSSNYLKNLEHIKNALFVLKSLKK